MRFREKSISLTRQFKNMRHDVNSLAFQYICNGNEIKHVTLSFSIIHLQNLILSLFQKFLKSS